MKLSGRCVGVTAASMALLAAVGVALFCARGALLRSAIVGALTLAPGSPLYAAWARFPVPVATSVYFFNVTNAAAVAERGARPSLAQVGPYVYMENHEKVNVVRNPENFTLTYQQVRSYTFNRELSVGGQDDVIVTLNPPAAAANAVGAKSGKIVRGLINLGLKAINEKLFVTRTVGELSFQGYKDPILTDTQWLPSSILPYKPDKFGYFYPRNNSDWFDGVFNMYTGADDIKKRGQIHAWNYSHTSSHYSGDCGIVRGAGDFFSPGLDAEGYVELYSNDLCRPLRLDFVDVESVGGIAANVYKMSKSFFANKTENPANACFDTKDSKEVPSGVYNLSACQYGVPVFMSQPHFYQADPRYLAQVESGLQPNRDKHETAFYIEPQSGLPVKVLARFQVNLYMKNLPEIGLYKSLPDEIFFPCVWFETSMSLPELMKLEVLALADFTTILAVVGMGLVGLSFACAVIVGLVYHSKKGARSAVPNESDTERSLLSGGGDQDITEQQPVEGAEGDERQEQTEEPSLQDSETPKESEEKNNES